MPRLPKHAIDELRDFLRSREELVQYYEGREQIETAYLALWAVLEKFVKTATKEYRKTKLKFVLGQWTAYLDGKQTTQPKDKPDIRLEVIHFPKKKEMIEALNHFGFNGAGIWKIMGTEGKPRDFRNQIVHTGRRFTRPKQYKKLAKQLRLTIKKTISK